MRDLMKAQQNIKITNLCQVDSSTLTFGPSPLPTERASGYFPILQCFIEFPVFNANSVDLDQMPHSVASDLCLHCLPMSLL